MCRCGIVPGPSPSAILPREGRRAAGVARMSPELLVPWRQTGMSKTMISRWPAGASAELTRSTANARSAEYRTITVCGPKEGKLRAGGCRLSIEVRPGSLPLPRGGRDACTVAHPRRRTEAIAVPDAPASDGVRMLEKRSKHCHFVPLFGPPSAPVWRRASRRSRERAGSLGREMWVAGRREGGVA
jgi:hypothetical protein